MSNLTIGLDEIGITIPKRLKGEKALTSVGIFSQFQPGHCSLPDTPAESSSGNGMQDPYGVKFQSELYIKQKKPIFNENKREMHSNRHNGDTDITMSFASSYHCQSEALILEDTQSDIIIPPTSPPHSHQLLMKSLTKQ